MTDTTNSDLMNQLLDISLDDLNDMPESKPYPNGSHKVNVTLKSVTLPAKDGKPEKLAMKICMKAIETLELSDPAADQPVKAGDESEVMYMLDNEFGQGAFKKIAKPLAAFSGKSTIGALLEAIQNIECEVVTTIRKGKKKPGDSADTPLPEYQDIKSLVVA